MATNHVNSGATVTLPAPTGGSVAGAPQVIGDLAVIPLQSGPKGTPITYRTCGAWNVAAAAGLKAGVKVSAKDGALVAAGTADALPFGKLLSDTLNGYAEVLIVQ
ncbi:hypothetical protein UB48_15150 [Pseudomonas sp. 2(2015)]|nr:hypothetical protein UB48_15150 [Pseudomonas sp. 2(2015)]